jgi:hypothetical protein
LEIFYGHLENFVVIWYTFPVLVFWTKKNLATLRRTRQKSSSPFAEKRRCDDFAVAAISRRMLRSANGGAIGRWQPRRRRRKVGGKKIEKKMEKISAGWRMLVFWGMRFVIRSIFVLCLTKNCVLCSFVQAGKGSKSQQEFQKFVCFFP